MRAFDIAAFWLVFNVVLTLLVVTGFYSGYVTIQPNQNYLSFINQSYRGLDTSVNAPEGVDPYALNPWLVFSAVTNAIVFITSSVGLAPGTLIMLGVPAAIAWPIQYIIYFVYGIGILQFFSGRLPKEMV